MRVVADRNAVLGRHDCGDNVWRLLTLAV